MKAVDDEDDGGFGKLVVVDTEADNDVDGGFFHQRIGQRNASPFPGKVVVAVPVVSNEGRHAWRCCDTTGSSRITGPPSGSGGSSITRTCIVQ
jgi:hypothetical protein